MPRSLCDRCQERQRQGGAGGGVFCRRCAREAGDLRTTREREADALRRRTRKIRYADAAPFVPYLKFTRGEWFLVVWDGSVRERKP